MSIVLVVSPHPDDETLGCGGTILRHKELNDKVHWLIMTRMSQDAHHSKEIIEKRENEIKSVSKEYSFVSVHQAGFVTSTLDTLSNSELINEVSKCFSEVQPNVIYVPFRGDAHSDHQSVFDAVAACTKSFRYPYVRKVLAYETISETDFSIRPDITGFKPNLWIDISKYVEQKIKIMHIYEGEIDEHPFPRSELSIRALSTLRGGIAGCKAAEAFMILKEIEKDE